MDRQKLINEILELVDSNPLNYIDIFPIIEKNSVGLDINEQRILRTNIIGALRDLRDNGDIDFNDGNFNITVTTAQIFQSSNGLIKSTLKRKEKLEQIERDKLKSQPTHQATFNAPFAGNFSQGDTDNTTQTFNETKKSEKPKWLTLIFYWEEIVKFGWKWIIVVIVGIVSGYLGFRSSKDKKANKEPPLQEQVQQPVQKDTPKMKGTAVQ